MLYITKLYYGNAVVEIVVKWADGSYSTYENPPYDLIQMFEALCQVLAYCQQPEYYVHFPSMCAWNDDTDYWRVVLEKIDQDSRF